MSEQEDEDFEDELDEDIEEEVQQERKPKKFQDTPAVKADDTVAEEPKERYVPFARPESFGIMDTVTEEVVAGMERPLQTTETELVNLRLQALNLNEMDQIKNSLGA